MREQDFGQGASYRAILAPPLNGLKNAVILY